VKGLQLKGFQTDKMQSMPQTCKICRHEGREEINRALVEGESFRSIASRTGTSATALHRHKSQHIPKSLALAKEIAVEIQAGTLFDRLRSVCRVTQEILREARGTKNHIIALQAIGRIERQLELEARLLGELDDSARVAIGIPVSSEPDLSDLTPEQLFAEQRILRETQERLGAVRAGRTDPLMIEAAAGSVEEVAGDEPDR
jgi:hypothetical protein